MKHFIAIMVLGVLTGCTSTSKIAVHCIPVSMQNSAVDPVQLLASLNTCVDEQEFSKAAELYYLSMGKAKFDENRTLNNNLTQVVAKHHKMFLSELPAKDAKMLSQQIMNKLKNNNEICRQLKKQHKSTHQVNYSNSLQLENKAQQRVINKIIRSFDTEKRWQQSIDEILGCP
ncbi:MAG: hypothetical protein ACPGUD_03550 [Parashewanella sp.]